MRTKRLLVFATLLLTAGYPLATLAQPARTLTPEFLGSTAPTQIDGWAAIKTDDGLLLVWNGRGLYFTLAINGKEVQPPNESENIFFYVDGKVLQIQVVEIETFAGREQRSLTIELFLPPIVSGKRSILKVCLRRNLRCRRST